MPPKLRKNQKEEEDDDDDEDDEDDDDSEDESSTSSEDTDDEDEKTKKPVKGKKLTKTKASPAKPKTVPTTKPKTGATTNTKTGPTTNPKSAALEQPKRNKPPAVAPPAVYGKNAAVTPAVVNPAAHPVPIAVASSAARAPKTALPGPKTGADPAAVPDEVDAEKGITIGGKTYKLPLPKWACFAIIGVVLFVLIIGGVMLAMAMVAEADQSKKDGQGNKTTTERPWTEDGDDTHYEREPEPTQEPGYWIGPREKDYYNYYETFPSGACAPPVKIDTLAYRSSVNRPLIEACQNDKKQPFQLPAFSCKLDDKYRLVNNLRQLLAQNSITHIEIDDASWGCKIFVIMYHLNYADARQFCINQQTELIMFDSRIEKCMVAREIVQKLPELTVTDTTEWATRKRYMWVSGQDPFRDQYGRFQWRSSDLQKIPGLQFCSSDPTTFLNDQTLLEHFEGRRLAMNLYDVVEENRKKVDSKSFGCFATAEKDEKHPFICKTCGFRRNVGGTPDCRYVCEGGYNYEHFDCPSSRL